MAEEVIGLLFGVEGVGVNGASGQEIVKGLTQIVNEINAGKSTVPKINFHFDTTEATKAIDDLKAKLKDIEKVASIKVTQSGGKSGQGGTTQDLQKQIEKYQRLSATIKQWVQTSKQAAKLSEEYSTITRKSDGSLSGSVKGYEQTIAVIDEVNKAMKELRITFDKDGKPIKPDKEQFAEIAAQIGITKEQYQKLFEQVESGSVIAAQNVENAKRTAQNATAKQIRNISQQIDTMYDTISKNPAVKKMADDLRKYMQSGSVDVGELKNKFDEFTLAAAKSGANIENWGDRFKKTFAGKVRSALAAAVTVVFTKYLREIYQNIVDIDKALVNLQIASGKTRAETKALIKEYAALAKQLGATTIEVAEAADTWLRQGYSAEEANTLIANSMMLSKLGQMESAEASKALTSAMKGYGITVEDSVKVVDKLTKVDMEAAASAGDIATAMAETATSAKLSGVSMDTLIGYLTTVKEVTQDGSESVGVFFKTLFARMNNVKAGKFIDDETGESLNDVESVLHKLGIELRGANDEFRNSSDVLSEVAARWDEFSDTERNAIATAMAGSRQFEKFNVLMTNYGTAMKYAEASTESAGTAIEKFSDYTSGIEAAFNSLQASFEELSMTLLNSELIVGFANFLAGVVEFLNMIASVADGMLVTIPAITLSLVALHAILLQIKTSKTFAVMAAGLKDILAIFPAILAQAKAWVLSLKAQALGHTMTTAALNAQVAATKAATAAQQAMNATNPIGWIMLAVTAIYGLVSGINAYTNSTKEAVRQSLDSAETHEQEAEAHKQNAESIEELIEQYKALAEENNGVFDSQTAEEVRGIQSKITDLVGEQAKNLDLVNGKLDDQLKIMKELSKEEYQKALTDATVGMADAENAYKDEVSLKSFEGTRYEVDANQATRDEFYKLAEEHGIKVEDHIYYGHGGMSASAPNIKFNFDDINDFVKQYEAVLELKRALAGEKNDTPAYKQASAFISDFEELYRAYTKKKELYDALYKAMNSVGESNNKTPKPVGAVVELKSTYDILEEVSDGYDGLASALTDVTSEGYLTADALASLTKLEKDGALAGLELSKILKQDANGYKLTEDALQKYVEALISANTIEGPYASSKDRKNAIANLENLRSVLATLMATQEESTDANKAYREELEKEQDMYEDQLDKFEELIDLRKELLQSYKEELDYQKELEKRQRNVSALQAKLSIARLDQSAAGQARVRELEAELESAQEDLEDFTLEHAIDVLTDQLESTNAEWKAIIQGKLDEITQLLEGLDNTPDVNVNVDTSWMQSSMASIAEAIKKISGGEVIDSDATGFGVSVGIDSRPKKNMFKVSLYHSGGLVGDSAAPSSDEEFAKLLKGEFVSTPAQMKHFMEDTLPRIANYSATGGSNEFNAPLIEITCESVTTEALPKLEHIVNEAVNEIKRELDSGMSRTGFKRTQTKRLT